MNIKTVFFVVIWPKKTCRHIKYQPRIDPTKVGHFWKIKNFKFDNNEICSIFPIDSLVFYVWDLLGFFLEKRIDSGPILFSLPLLSIPFMTLLWLWKQLECFKSTFSHNCCFYNSKGYWHKTMIDDTVPSFCPNILCIVQHHYLGIFVLQNGKYFFWILTKKPTTKDFIPFRPLHSGLNSKSIRKVPVGTHIKYISEFIEVQFVISIVSNLYLGVVNKRSPHGGMERVTTLLSRGWWFDPQCRQSEKLLSGRKFMASHQPPLLSLGHSRFTAQSVVLKMAEMNFTCYVS